MKKNILKYLFVIVLIILYIILFNVIFSEIRKNEQQTYQINFMLNTSLRFIYYFGFGLIFGISTFKIEIKKVGKFKLNIPKIIIMGIPSLFLSFLVYLFSYIGIYIPVINDIPYFLSFNNNTSSVFSILFGYIAITSFYKVETQKITENNY